MFVLLEKLFLEVKMPERLKKPKYLFVKLNDNRRRTTEN